MKFDVRCCSIAGLAFAVASFAALPAQATIYNGMTMPQLKSVLTVAGASVTEVRPGILRIEDGPLVELTQCPPQENGVCYEIAIGRTFDNVKPTLAAVNSWNYNTKIPEASVDDSGYLHMEFWVTTVGITEQLLIDSIGWFEGAWKAEEAQEFWTPYMVGPGV